jgi:hypothetical protein
MISAFCPENYRKAIQYFLICIDSPFKNWLKEIAYFEVRHDILHIPSSEYTLSLISEIEAQYLFLSEALELILALQKLQHEIE